MTQSPPVRVQTKEDKLAEIGEHMACVLRCLGMPILTDPSVRDTPTRFAKYLLEYYQPIDIDEALGRVFKSPDNAMVLQYNIPFRMICEHHLLPATGKAAVGYVPHGQVVGLSKLTRLVQAVGTEKPSLQEHICDRIADMLHNHIKPFGTMVVIEAEHGCMACRGVNSPGITTTTSCLRGVFMNNATARAEFFSLLQLRGTR